MAWNKRRSFTKETYLPFEEARRYVQSIRLTSGKEFKVYMKKAKPGEYIKSGKVWVIGLAPVTFDKKYRSFEEARKYARSIGLKSKTEWEKYCRE